MNVARRVGRDRRFPSTEGRQQSPFPLRRRSTMRQIGGFKSSPPRFSLFSVYQEASWTNPHEATAGGGGGGAPGGGVEVSGGGLETLSQPEDGRAKWTECLDEASGSTYYYNVVTVGSHGTSNHTV